MKRMSIMAIAGVFIFVTFFWVNCTLAAPQSDPAKSNRVKLPSPPPGSSNPAEGPQQRTKFKILKDLQVSKTSENPFPILGAYVIEKSINAPSGTYFLDYAIDEQNNVIYFRVDAPGKKILKYDIATGHFSDFFMGSYPDLIITNLIMGQAGLYARSGRVGAGESSDGILLLDANGTIVRDTQFTKLDMVIDGSFVVSGNTVWGFDHFYKKHILAIVNNVIVKKWPLSPPADMWEMHSQMTMNHGTKELYYYSSNESVDKVIIYIINTTNGNQRTLTLDGEHSTFVPRLAVDDAGRIYLGDDVLCDTNLIETEPSIRIFNAQGTFIEKVPLPLKPYECISNLSVNAGGSKISFTVGRKVGSPTESAPRPMLYILNRFRPW